MTEDSPSAQPASEDPGAGEQVLGHQPANGVTGDGESDRARSFDQVAAAEAEAVRRGRRLRGSRDAGATVAAGRDASQDDGRDVEDPPARALAFSGGGIRSAIFNLGLTQGLARRGILSRFDYLSINSGGSYIGGWLLAWIRRDGIGEVERQLGEGAHPEPDDGADPAATGEHPGPEPGPVSFLRRFSNYLTPRVGAFSADTWTLVTTYLRNLILNLVVLVLALAALLVLPRLLVLASSWFYRLDPLVPLRCGIAALAVGVVMMALNQLEVLAPREGSPPWYAAQAGIQLAVLLPLFVAAWLAGLWMWLARVAEDFFLRRWLAARWSWYAESPLHQEQLEPVAWAILGGLLYALVWCAGSLLFLTLMKLSRRQPTPGQKARSRRLTWLFPLSALPAGAVGGALLWAEASLGLQLESGLSSYGYANHSAWHLLHVTVWKAPAIIGVFILTAFLQTGLLGRSMPESFRQWWSRLGAWMLIWGITWLGVFGVALYGPVLLVVLGFFVTTVLGGGWIVSTVGGVLVGRRTGDGGEAPSPLRRLVISLAPQVFIVGLLALLALAVHAALDPPEHLLSPECRDRFWIEAPAEAVSEGTESPIAAVEEEADLEAQRVRRVVRCHTERLYLGTTREYSVVANPDGPPAEDGHPGTVPLVFVILTGLALVLSWRVDINQFSMHLFYRDRLIRAFLGASNRDRRAQPFTGFDPADDVPLAKLSPLDREDPFDGPYPIVNIALNLVAGEELAWQERKAASFAFCPLYSGFQVHGERLRGPDRGDPGGGDAGHREAGERLQPAGYRPTSGYDQAAGRSPEGISLGTAMAISGAAASPNRGAGTTPAMAFLLTVFNVRLGWWLGNPRHRDTWHRMGPRVGLFALLAELFGGTDDRSRYVYLSDGGHFDNLGLYELIRRRCRFIVVSDASADPETTFGDLGNAVRKACTDFGVEIELDLGEIHKGAEAGWSGSHWAVGTIRYDKVDGGPPGTLVYVKASLTGDEPADVRSYAADHPTFPHEATADQWFSESQFESYRKLGEHIGLEVAEHLTREGGGGGGENGPGAD